jgi:hypothetical protein
MSIGNLLYYFIDFLRLPRLRQRVDWGKLIDIQAI